MRNDRLGWSDYNMLMACVAALRSPDPNTQVGAYICGPDNTPLSLGYNGTPKGLAPEEIPWERKAPDPLETKYPYIVHGERNAILNAHGDLHGAKLWVTMHPCNECAVEIIQAGITEVHYLSNPYKDTWSVQAAEWMFDMVGIKSVKHTWNYELMKTNVTALLKLMSLPHASLEASLLPTT